MTRRVLPPASPPPPSPPPEPPARLRLLDHARECMRVRHYSIRTEKAYLHWMRRYIRFHGLRHPRELGGTEVQAFLTHLAVDGSVTAATQNQALAALLFLYRVVLEQDLPWLADVVRARRPRRLPVVLSEAEVRQVLSHLDGTVWLVASLMYGAGLRLMECVRLRVKDIEPSRRCVLVREGKGGKDRITVLPDALLPHLQAQVERVRALHEQDLAAGTTSTRSACSAP